MIDCLLFAPYNRVDARIHPSVDQGPIVRNRWTLAGTSTSLASVIRLVLLGHRLRLGESPGRLLHLPGFPDVRPGSSDRAVEKWVVGLAHPVVDLPAEVSDRVGVLRIRVVSGPGRPEHATRIPG